MVSQLVQILIDTAWAYKTMVSADYLPTDCLDHFNKERILCVHGDEVCYPTAEVRLKLGRWSQKAKVHVHGSGSWHTSPSLAIGTDI